MQVGSLGDVVFEVSPLGMGRTLFPQNFTRERKARYEEHKVLGDLPRMEFLAAELATANISVLLRADLGIDPAAELEKLEAMCSDGKAHTLILGGRNLGRHVLLGVSTTVAHMLRDKLFSLHVRLELKEYI